MPRRRDLQPLTIIGAAQRAPETSWWIVAPREYFTERCYAELDRMTGGAWILNGGKKPKAPRDDEGMR